MNILQIAQEACRRAKEPTISNLFSSTEQSQEYLGYANQMASKIMDMHFWRAILSDYSFTTDLDDLGDPKQYYDLPEDFDSFVVNFIFDKTRQEYLENSEDNESMATIISNNNTQSLIKWRIIGTQIKFDVPIDAGRELIFTYKKNICIRSTIANPDFDQLLDPDPITNPETLTSYTNTFVNNDSAFLLNDEFLILGILLQRAINFGFPETPQREKEFNEKFTNLVMKENGLRNTNVFSKQYYNRISPVEYQKVIK